MSWVTSGRASGMNGRIWSRAVGGLEAGEDVLEVAAAAVEPLAQAVDQQLEVVAGVGVEGGEDLVGVDVGQGVVDRDRESVAGRRCLVGPGVELDEHVLEAGL